MNTYSLIHTDTQAQNAPKHGVHTKPQPMGIIKDNIYTMMCNRLTQPQCDSYIKALAQLELDRDAVGQGDVGVGDGCG